MTHVASSESIAAALRNGGVAVKTRTIPVSEIVTTKARPKRTTKKPTAKKIDGRSIRVTAPCPKCGVPVVTKGLPTHQRSYTSNPDETRLKPHG